LTAGGVAAVRGRDGHANGTWFRRRVASTAGRSFGVSCKLPAMVLLFICIPFEYFSWTFPSGQGGSPYRRWSRFRSGAQPQGTGVSPWPGPERRR